MCAAHPVTTAHCRPAASVIFHSANDTGLGNDFEVLISQFRFSDGRPAVLLQNHGADVNLWASVEFCGQEVVNTLREVDSSTGEEGPVYDDSPLAYGTQFAVGAGDVRLFVISKGGSEASGLNVPAPALGVTEITCGVPVPVSAPTPLPTATARVRAVLASPCPCPWTIDNH
jgi:hypothetical protein